MSGGASMNRQDFDSKIDDIINDALMDGNIPDAKGDDLVEHLHQMIDESWIEHEPGFCGTCGTPMPEDAVPLAFFGDKPDVEDVYRCGECDGRRDD